MNYGMIAGNFVLGFWDFYICICNVTMCEISLIYSVDFQRNTYYSLFVTLLSKVIDSRFRVHISRWFTTYHFKTSKGISSTLVKNYWNGHFSRPLLATYIAAALIRIMYYKPCWAHGFQGTYQFKYQKSGWQRGFIKQLRHINSSKFDAAWKERGEIHETCLTQTWRNVQG